MYARFYFLFFIFILFSSNSFCQTQKDTIYAAKSIVPIVIDGSANDACWAEAEWKPINQVWIPYAATMAKGDFEGKYKTAWDGSYLYVLVEVIDDMLSDDHLIPTQNWWDDDCLEVMIDEDRSKGNHERNNNAFAYHISLKYDAIDLDASGNGVNYRNNIIVKMDTIGVNTYLWEIAIKVYDASFTLNNPEASRVQLTTNKLMGFTIAYCDNDKTTSRENFIGSMYMTAATANDNYITANYFGSMLLVDKLRTSGSNPGKIYSKKLFSAFPNPAINKVILEKMNNSSERMLLEIRSATGALLKTMALENSHQTIDIDDLTPGVYLFTVSSDRNFQSEKIVKQ